eukprot:scaffold397410_cov20-Prasinocladus_malaysianus.AAC.1
MNVNARPTDGPDLLLYTKNNSRHKIAKSKAHYAYRLYVSHCAHVGAHFFYLFVSHDEGPAINLVPQSPVYARLKPAAATCHKTNEQSETL